MNDMVCLKGFHFKIFPNNKLLPYTKKVEQI